METRYGDWIETYTGIKFYPLDPRLEEIVVEDMIHAICNICRFGGHSKIFYSVGQHSLLVYRYLTERGYSATVRLYGLTHDFTEAYLVDVPRPVKRMLHDYKRIEEQLFELIWQSFDVPKLDGESKEVVKQADELVLYYEACTLGLNKNNWAQDIDLGYPIQEEKPSDVKVKLSHTLHRLLKEIHSQ